MSNSRDIDDVGEAFEQRRISPDVHRFGVHRLGGGDLVHHDRSDAGSVGRALDEGVIGNESKAHVTGIQTMGIPVEDQDRALDFYTAAFGFEKRMDAPVPQLGGRWLVVAPPGSVMSLALVPAHDGLPAGAPTGIRLSTDDAVALYAGLTARGVDVDDLLFRAGVPPMFAFGDPDGNVVSISGN